MENICNKKYRHIKINKRFNEYPLPDTKIVNLNIKKIKNKFIASETINLVNGTGVIATDSTGAGSARNSIAAASYGGSKGIFGFGYISSNVSMTNLCTSEGVLAADGTGVGTAREQPGALMYGGDKAIFGFGSTGSVTNLSNLVSNAGVVATDTTGVGTSRTGLGACNLKGSI